MSAITSSDETYWTESLSAAIFKRYGQTLR
jgi:hypothetical protein